MNITQTVDSEHVPDAIKTFQDFDVDPLICEALERLGISTPFPIQEVTLPLALSGADLIGQARTGTGKTLAFGIPILQNVTIDNNTTQALVVVPTRELCLQVHDDLAAAGARKGTTIVAAYGGRAIDPQSEAIAGGAEVVVGTPGRLLDLLRRGLLHLSTVTTLVLDEADEMLDMGFLPDVEQLIEACAPKRQTLLFSATMPSEVVALARRYMTKPTFMRADVEESPLAPATRQHFFAVHRMDKPALVARILATPQRGRCVIFTRTKRMADMLVKDLRDADLNVAAIHSDLRQEAREKTLARFRSGKIDVMCATEVAARGLDIDAVTHVINYDCPDDEKMYLHRIGRTGRAGADGVAITLVIWSELARLDMIKKALDIGEPTLEVFSTSEVLDGLFPLAAGQPRAAAPRSSAAAPAADHQGSEDRRPRASRRKGGASARQADVAATTREPRKAADQRDPAQGAAVASFAANDPGDDTTLRRRRVRQRSSGRGSRRSPADGSARSRSDAPADAGPDASETAGPKSTPTTAEPSRGPQAPAEEALKPARAEREQASRRRNAARRQGRGRNRREEHTRQTHGTPGRSDASRTPESEADSTHTPDAAARQGTGSARGAGKPGLRRPLRIAHLP